MKKIFALVSLLTVVLASQAQAPSCCTANVTAQNAALAMNTSFAASHLEPLMFTLGDPKGTMVEYPTMDGKPGKGYLVHSGNPKSKKWLFLFTEWWGLNDYMKREADKLAADLKDVNVMAIDLYDGNVASAREDAQKYMSSMTEERTNVIIKGAYAYAGKSAKVATLGYCSGGSWSLLAAIIGGSQVKACVMYYGMPEMNVAKLKTLRTDVLGIFAEKDNFINVEVVKAFEGKMKEAGKKIVVYNYVAEHAFANPSNPQYNQQAAEDAYKNKVLPYLKKNMKIKQK
jgi:carboxymethylenebutenolidase